MRKYITLFSLILFININCWAQTTYLNQTGTTYLNQSGSVGTTIKADDCSVNNTGDWSLANCTLTFDTDHYEIVYTNTTQFVYQGAVSTTNGNTYTISADVKDGNSAGVSGRIFLYTGVVLDGGEGKSFVTTNTWQTISEEIVAGENYDTLGVYSTMTGAGDFEIKNIILSEGTGTAEKNAYIQ